MKRCLHTYSQRGSFLLRPNPAVSSQGAQSSVPCGPPWPQGHPPTALPGPDPGVLIKCKKKRGEKASSSPRNKEQVPPTGRAKPWRSAAQRLATRRSSAGSTAETGRLFWKREEKLAGQEYGPQPPPQSDSIFGFLKVNLIV